MIAHRDDPQFTQQPRSKQRILVWVAKLLLIVVMPVSVGWIVYKVTRFVYVPDGVRRYESISEELQKHATAIRMGAIKPEPESNGMLRYPLTDELRRAECPPVSNTTGFCGMACPRILSTVAVPTS